MIDDVYETQEMFSSNFLLHARKLQIDFFFPYGLDMNYRFFILIFVIKMVLEAIIWVGIVVEERG